MIKVTNEYGIIIKKSKMLELGLSKEQLFKIMETDEPFDESSLLISFGPHFGGEAADEFAKRLQAIGFEYFDDFFIMCGDFPEWAKFKVCIDAL